MKGGHGWRPLRRRSLVLATDFGAGSFYVGELHARLHALPRGVRAVDFTHELPVFAAEAAGLLLAAHWPYFPPDPLLLAVVDPGVGGARDALVIEHRSVTCVGPDNGLFAPLLDRLGGAFRTFRLAVPENLPAVSFHGRDLFLPAAIELLRGRLPCLLEREPTPVRGSWRDHDEILVLDRYGNAVTGRRAETRRPTDVAVVAGRTVAHARVFEEARDAFWYANSAGLVEIAWPRGSAARELGLEPGMPVCWREHNGG